jgi:hypothetical protein
MANYTLNIAFTAEQLKALDASGFSIVLAKPVSDWSSKIVWLVFKPLASNTVKWNDDYGVYFSNDVLKPGAVIRKTRSQRASRGNNYALTPDGSIMESQGYSDTYVLANNSMQRMVAGGLWLDGMVNGSNEDNRILSVENIYEGNSQTIRPPKTVSIWLQSQVSAGTVFESAVGPVTELNFTGSNTISVKYDSNSKKFVG